MSWNWKKIAEMAPQEAQQYEELPAGVWFRMTTATEANGEAAPKIQAREGKPDDNGDRKTFHIFKTGLLATHGESGKVSKKHKGGMLFLESFIHPSEQQIKEDPEAFLSGRFTGILNCLFASGVGDGLPDTQRAAARWSATATVLEGVATKEGLTLEQYDGDVALFVAGCAVAALQTNSMPMLVKSKQEKYQRKEDPKGVKGGTKVAQGQFEDATDKNMTARNQVPLDGIGAAPKTTF